MSEVRHTPTPVKLPKQWRNWCADSRLFRMGCGGKGKWRDFYLVGRGYVWRVNMHGEFERGDSYAAFDRWALCRIDSAPMPRTREQFRAFVADAIAKA
jgi:hypothetical protein